MDITAGYKEARRLAASHYENFPVVSLFIKKDLRNDVAVVYWFARTADDLADEGDATPEERLSALDAFERDFQNALSGNPKTGLEAALIATIRNRRLNPADFLALLSAFKQDVVKKRYKSMDELLDYSNRSANPVGRIILDLHGIHDEESKLLSDKICTALQLTNFWQDVSVDLQKDRIYVPGDKVQIKSESEELIKNSNDETLTSNQTGKGHIAGDLGNDHIKELCRYTGRLFDDGAELINRLPTPLRYEIAWTVAGGKNILEKIKKIDYNVLSERVTLSKVDFLFLALKVFING